VWFDRGLTNGEAADVPGQSGGPDRDELTARWSALHHDIDPARMPMVARWLRMMWAGGRVLDRAGIAPTAITAAGVLLAGAAVVVANDRPRVAGVAVIGAALCDGLDGATAIVSGRATRSGAWADAVADRVCDGAFAAVLWRRGAPARTALTAAGLAWGVDILRRVRRMPDRVTVAERPTFTICAAVACASSVVMDGERAARISAAVWIAAGTVGVAQLLSTPPPAEECGRLRTS
jgi:phosphatidylglycerophosphate synthase